MPASRRIPPLSWTRTRRLFKSRASKKVFGYQHSDIEETLLEAGGILPLYSRYGRAVFRQMTAAKSQQPANSNRVDVVDAPTFQGRTRQTKTGLDW